ncbi:MAG TPA: hypothetical protein VNA16_10980 [Abditibacteriaceae bacterium]|nr:hypothetical protein [Abditibacteriaceae bacterium]
MIKQFFFRPATGANATHANTHRWGPWHCAGYSSLVLAGLIAFNLAGCGGGSGSPAFKAADVTIDLRNVGGDVLNGTVRLRGVNSTFDTTLTTVGGTATFTDVKTGNYLVTVTYNTGTPTTQTDDLTVGGDKQQTFVAVQGVTGIPGAGITISGRIFSGSPGCTVGTSLGLAAKVLVRVREINPRLGNPIVSTFVKPFQNANSGAYTIFNIPPGSASDVRTYIVEVRQAPAEGGEATAPFCGQSSSFSIPSTPDVLSNIDICANSDACRVGSTPTPPPGTPTPTTGGGGPPVP